MATIDLGKIKFNWRGTYAGGTAYVPDDVVYYMDGSVGSSYMCVANTTGNAPSSGGTLHASWQYLAKGQATSPTTNQGDIIVRGASADARLAIGAAGKVLKVNSSGNGLEYGTGFAGTHYLAYDHDIHHGTGVSVNGNGIANGNADGQRDCIVINNGLYFTVTPSHNDDIFIMNVTTNIFTYWNSNGSYWGLGFMSATSTNFANNRNFFYLMGQHAFGQGSALSNYDNYCNCCVTQQFNTTEMNLNVGTTYYIRPVAQIHSSNNTVSFNQNNGSNQRSNFNSWLRHYKKNT